MRPLRQFDFRKVGGDGIFGAEGDFLAGVDLVLGGLREPVPFPVGLAERVLTALSFQFAQADHFIHTQFQDLEAPAYRSFVPPGNRFGEPV